MKYPLSGWTIITAGLQVYSITMHAKINWWEGEGGFSPQTPPLDPPLIVQMVELQFKLL